MQGGQGFLLLLGECMLWLRVCGCVCALGPHVELRQHNLRKLNFDLPSLPISLSALLLVACPPACLPEPGLVMPMPILTGPACQAGPESLLLLLLCC